MQEIGLSIGGIKMEKKLLEETIDLITWLDSQVEMRASQQKKLDKTILKLKEELERIEDGK